MKRYLAIVTLLAMLLPGLQALAADLILFPDKSILEVTLVATNPASGVFILEDRNGEQIAGTVHDQIGIERAIVVEISGNSLTVENVEIVIDPTGREIEQPTRMKIPLAFAMDGKGVQ